MSGLNFISDVRIRGADSGEDSESSGDILGDYVDLAGKRDRSVRSLTLIHMSTNVRR